MNAIPSDPQARERYVQQLLDNRKPLSTSAEYAAPIFVEFGTVVPVFRKTKFRRKRRALRRQTEYLTLAPIAFMPMPVQVRRRIAGTIAEHTILTTRAYLYVSDIGRLYTREYGDDENALAVKPCPIGDLTDDDIRRIAIGASGDSIAIHHELTDVFNKMIGDDE